MDDFHDMWWNRDMKKTCRKIARDLRSRALKDEKFVDPGWTGWEAKSASSFGYFKALIEKVPPKLHLDKCVYQWNNGIPLLNLGPRPQRVVPASGQLESVDVV